MIKNESSISSLSSSSSSSSPPSSYLWPSIRHPPPASSIKMAVVWALVTVVVLAARIDPVTAQGVNTSVSMFESKYKVSEFKSPAKNISLRNMIVNTQNQDVFIGAVNHIYGLDVNLKLKVDLTTGPKNDTPLCPPPGNELSCDKPKKPTNDLNKVLIIDYQNNNLFSCGTLYHGLCHKRNLSDPSSSIALKQHPIATNDPKTKVVAYIAPGPRLPNDDIQHNALYVSVSWTTKTKSTFIDISALAARNMEDFGYFAKTFFSRTGVLVGERERQEFPVDFKYGFSSENFSYMLSVHKVSLDKNMFGSKIARICQNDKNFFSYVEVPLNCKRGDTHYNILRAAYTTKAGRKLAESLKIDTQKDVLYALFSVGKHSSATPTDQNALCVYPLEEIRKKFTENIRRCFNGEGVTGGNHLGSTFECTVNKQFIINDTYCGETESNQPLSGVLPCEKEAVMVFPTSLGNVTSLGVAKTYNYTVAFVGTQSGRLVKVAVENKTSAHVYEIVETGLGSAIQSDMPFDDNHNHLYLMTSSKVVKMKVDECSQYTTCTDCLAASDPYCGWCLPENRCSRSETCQDINQSKTWLPYDSQLCPLIKEVLPHLILANKEKLLTLGVQNFPDFEGYTFHCLFSSLADADNSVPAVKTVAERSNTNFQCYTPKVDQLPVFGDGKDSVRMELSVLMNNQAVDKQVVTFFDCNVHSSCTSCTQSQFPCSWCIKNHLCTDNTERHCDKDVLVPGLNDTSTNILSQGPDYCPQFRNVETGTEILVAAGSKVNVKVKAESLHDFQMDNLRCQFNFDKSEVVPAKAELVQGRVYNIICDKLDFKYMRHAQFRNVSLKIRWGGGDYPLDNPTGVLVVMYKCSSMANTCGDCLMVDAKYRCGWCKQSREHCTTDMFCRGTTKFLEQGATCLDPHIESFFPKSGPIEGGTLITINGKNLGFNQKEVFVTVGGTACDTIGYEAPKMIVCQTQKQPRKQWASLLNKPVMVRVGIGLGTSQIAKADSYTFVQPSIDEIWPNKGPFDGGTIVTVKGKHLDTGSKLTVNIGTDKECLDPKSLNSTAITCTTTPLSYSVPSPSSLTSSGAAVAVASASTSSNMDVRATIDNAVLPLIGMAFVYVSNPNVTWMSRYSVLRSGGQLVNVSGQYLDHVQSPLMVIWHDGLEYTGPCKFSTNPTTNMTCVSPSVTSLHYKTSSPVQLQYGFIMDGVKALRKIGHLNPLEVYPDPVLDEYEEGVKQHPRNHDTLYIQGRLLDPVSKSDVKIHIGDTECPVNSVANTIITCSPPMTQPSALVGSGPPEVVVTIGQNLTYKLGVLKYEEEEGLSKLIIIVIAIVSAVILVTILIVVVCCVYKFRRNDDMVKKMRKEMDQLESRVANECKEAFAELQTDMTELTSETDGSVSIPFWDYRTYCMRVLFPGCQEHPVIRELELDYSHRDDTVYGLKLFFNLVRNKTFLLSFIRTLESRKDFTIKERVNVASLISVALQTQMEYNTEILKILLAELIEKTVKPPKSHPQLLLRRNESVAEKMLTNWFTFLLYRFLKDCAGEPLFMLYGAIKQQVSKGPVDFLTSEARYSLSEDKLIRQQIDFQSMVIHVKDIDADRCSQPYHPVKVLDCDTISQVKEKILDAIFKSAPFTSRPRKEDLDLVYFDHNPSEWTVDDKSQIPLKMFPKKDTRSLVLSDEDHTTKTEGTKKRFNTLSHYKVPDGAFVALHPKQTSMYNNLSFVSDKSSKFSEHSFYNQSPSLTRNMNSQNLHMDVEGQGCKPYHLVRNQDAELSNKEGDRGNKMVSEIYLPRLLVTKGTLQSFVDDLFERIFSTAHRGTALPLAIKYMFDFLDDQALHHGVSEEAVHIWKSNSLPLRFWVNVIKNPNFAFDIYKSNIVDSCLTVIGQTFMDCCSNQEHKLTKDSPSCKLLFAKDIPKYKQWVARYYQDIKIMPAISDQDMTAMLTEESRTHQNEFNTNAALLELYKYVKKYFEDIYTALEEDEFAKKSKLTSKLEQVAHAMDGTTIC